MSDGFMAAGLIGALLLPVAGFIIGLTQLGKKGGIVIVILSLVSLVIWIAVLNEAFTDSTSYYEDPLYDY